MRRLLALSLICAGCVAAAGQRSPAPTVASETAESHVEGKPQAAPGAKLDPSEAASMSRADFFGAGYPPKPPAQHGPGRVGSLGWGTWIQPKPDSRSLPLGSIRLGSRLPLLDDTVTKGLGKCSSFVRVKHGFVCATRRATLDLDSEFLQAHRWTTPAPGPFPYEYAFSVGAPMLTRVPAPDENHWSTGKRQTRRLRGWAEGHDELAMEELIQPNGEMPDFLHDGRTAPSPWGKYQGTFFKRIPFGSMLAYTRAFQAHGEVWVLSTNLTVVPAKGLKRFRRSRFQGVELGGKVRLPIAWIRKEPRRKWRRTNAGFEPTDKSWPVRSWVALTGKQEREGKRRFWETREPGVYIQVSDATVVQPADKRPWEVKGDQKWIHVRVNRGTLTLYQGLRAAFTTLMSPGKEDATPYGRYRIESKHHVTTMTTESGEPKKFWIADVPWTVYFKRPYAIHGTYWHEDFGERKSGGCVNLSPLDAKRVFDWTEPPLPEGWGSVQAYGMGGGTFVLVEG